MSITTDNSSDSYHVPDIRQSLVYTLLAASFALLGVINPFLKETSEGNMHKWMLVAILAVMFVSWYFFIKRLASFRKLPGIVRAIQLRRQTLDRSRATHHLLLCAMALALTTFSFLNRAFIPDNEITLGDEITFYTSAVIAASSSAVISRALRDIVTIKKKELKFAKQRKQSDK